MEECSIRGQHMQRHWGTARFGKCTAHQEEQWLKQESERGPQDQGGICRGKDWIV